MNTLHQPPEQRDLRKLAGFLTSAYIDKAAEVTGEADVGELGRDVLPVKTQDIGTVVEFQVAHGSREFLQHVVGVSHGAGLFGGFKKFRRIAANDGIRRNVFGDHGSGSHDGILADGYALQDGSPGANPGVRRWPTWWPGLASGTLSGNNLFPDRLTCEAYYLYFLKKLTNLNYEEISDFVRRGI